MPSIHFNPKITTDLQIDWRRAGSGRTSDLFAELLADRMKRNAEADRRNLPAPRALPHPEAVSGRPQRPEIEHPRTVRGEAKEIDQPGQRVGHQKHHSREEAGAEATAAATESTDSSVERDAAGKAAESESPSSENAIAAASGQAVADSPETTQPVGAIAIVPIQQSQQAAPDDGLTVPLQLPVASDPADIAPDQAGDAAGQVPAAESDAKGAAPDQQASQAMAAAGLSQVAADVKTNVAPESVNVPVVAAQPVVGSAAMPVQAEEAAVRITLIAAPPHSDALPAPAQAQPTRPAEDAKLRPNPSARANGGAPAAHTAGAAAQQPAQPATATTLPSSSAGAFDGMDRMFEHPLSAEEAGPGWTLHLAQGAASRRTEFLAQLRQHLQNLPAHEQVAVHLQRAVREGTGRLSVQLSPAELGRIHVKLEIDEDRRVTAAVTVERPSTLELLQRDIRGLERALHNAGLAMEGGDLSFSLGSGNDQEFAQDLNQRAASAAGGSVLDGQAAGDQPAESAAQLMDTAAGIVDLQV